MTVSHDVPVTIIAGFLGAGKTTLLNHILSTAQDKRIAVVVNDFGALNIDAQLLVEVKEQDVVTLSNGCICCTISGDLQRAVLNLLQRPEPPEHILIEASGVSDPLEIALNIRAVRGVFVESVLTVMSAEQLQDVDRRYAALAIYQVGMADIVVLNKIDLVSEAERQAARAYIQRVLPQARIIETTQGRLPMSLVFGLSEPIGKASASQLIFEAHATSAHDAPDHSHDFQTWHWSSSQPLSYRALKRAVNSLPKDIYRAKGIFFLADTPDQRAVLHVVGKRVTLTMNTQWRTDETPLSQCVMIGAHGSLNPDALEKQFNACLAINAPKSELEHLTNSVLSWLRGRLSV